ncbi:MAG: prolyl oligopeptidase family serine peptidase, partial [Thermoflexales bacterium]
MTTPSRRGLVSDDLFGVRWLDEPRLTPEGGRLAYSMTGLDRERDAMLSWVRVGVGESAPEQEGRSPCWSPDGATLAFVSGDQRRLRLWLGGDDIPRDLPPQPDPIAHPRWSPDGGRLAFISGGRLWLSVLTEGAARPLTDGAFPVELPVWLDADTLACVSVAPDGVSARVWRVSAGAPPVVDCVLAFGGPIRALAAAPDGRTLAFIGHDRGAAQGVNFGLWLLPLDTGEAARNLTAGFDRSVGLAVRSDDARGMAPPDLAWIDRRGISRIYFIFCEGGSSHIAWAGLDGRVRVVVDGERACLSFSVTAEALTFIVSHAYQPGEAHVADLDGKREWRATEVNGDWVRQFDFRAHRPLPVLADDGRTIEAWLLEPAEASLDQKFPLILQIHGGPHYAIGNRFYFEFQRLAAQGYGVLFANPRGSQGYGEEHATVIRGAWGGRDYLDIMQTVETALRDPRVDAGRLTVTGVSYGAY